MKTEKLEANFFESLTTADISSFISSKVRRQALAPKTANRYREIFTRLFNWALGQYGVVLAGGYNPAAKVERYKERASKISFLTKEQIEVLSSVQKTITFLDFIYPLKLILSSQTVFGLFSLQKE